MNRRIMLTVFPAVLALVTAACAGATTTTPEPFAVTATEPAQRATPLPSPTAVPAAADIPGCSVVSEKIAPAPPVDSPFPAVSDNDWAHGPTGASVTLVEYGDFQ